MQMVNTYKCPECNNKFKAGISRGVRHRKVHCSNCGKQLHLAASKIQKDGYELIHQGKAHYLHKSLLN